MGKARKNYHNKARVHPPPPPCRFRNVANPPRHTQLQQYFVCGRPVPDLRVSARRNYKNKTRRTRRGALRI
jgi:hypothetical protein